MTSAMDYSGFADRVIRLIDLPPDRPVGPTDDLYAEVGLDSLQAFQLAEWIGKQLDISGDAIDSRFEFVRYAESLAGDDPADQLNPESTIFQENSGPQGVLP